MTEKLTLLDADLDSSDDPKDLFQILRKLDSLNKEVSMKVQCCKVEEEKLQRVIRSSQVNKEKEEERLDNFKEHCRTLKQELKEVEGIKEKTRVNHENRMEQINNNFKQVRTLVQAYMRGRSKTSHLGII